MINETTHNKYTLKKTGNCLIGGGTQDGMPSRNYLFGNEIIGIFGNDYLEKVFLDYNLNWIIEQIQQGNIKNPHQKHNLKEIQNAKWIYIESKYKNFDDGFKTIDKSNLGQITTQEYDKFYQEELTKIREHELKEFANHLDKSEKAKIETHNYYTSSWRDSSHETIDHIIDVKWSKFKKQIEGFNLVKYNPTSISNFESFNYLKLGFQNTYEEVANMGENKTLLEMIFEPRIINSKWELNLTDFVLENKDKDKLILRTPAYLNPQKQICPIINAQANQPGGLADKDLLLINEKGWLFGYDYEKQMAGKYDGQITIDLTEKEQEKINELDLNKTAWKLSLRNKDLKN